MKIKFKLVKFERALIFQILEMDERFRYMDYINSFKSKLCVQSELNPGMGNSILYLRGAWKARDFDIKLKYFDSNDDRDIYFDKIIASFRDWATDWEGFRESKNNNSIEDKYNINN